MIEQLTDHWAGAEFWGEVATFLSLVLGSLGLALLLGVPLGVALTRLPRVSGPVIAVLGVLQTIPSLALLGLLIPLIGIGNPAAIVLAVIYSLFPVVMNTYVGIRQVSPAIRDAARGMGMTGGQILWQVEMPLSLPVLLAGVRTAAVYAISIVTIAALAAAGGLGGYIVRGSARLDNVLLAVGAIPLLVLTLLVFWGLGGVAWVARRSSRAGLYLGGGLILALSLHGMWVVGQQFTRARGGPEPAAGQPGKLVIGAKNFVEGEILAEIVKQMIEAHTSLRCEVKKNLTPNIIYKSLKSGDLDLYPEYTGNLLANKEALGLPVPADKATITRVVREGMREKHSLVLLETFGLNNTYALCAPKDLARKHDLRTISDLKRVPTARVVVDLDFLDRDDGWKGLVKTYSLELPRPMQLSPDLRYRALTSGDADIVCGFATDWEIAFYDLAVLEDDRGYFPNYHGAPLVREEVLKCHSEIAKVLNRLAGQIDDATMRRLNFQVAREQRSEQEVARTFLTERGLLDRAP